jgi:hypothetical protein
MHGTNDGAAAGDPTASTRSGGGHEWGALDAELDERLDRDESAPTSWGGRVALEPGERFKGFLRGTTPNPAEDRHDVVLLETMEREPSYMYGSRMLLGELEKSGARPGDMVAIGRRIEDGVNARGQSYPFFRVRSRPFDRETGV